jgi:chemotaxis protein CheX
VLVRLPPVMDLGAAQELAGELMACRGGPAALDASDVQRVGSLGLQVLISARKAWQADGQALSLTHPSTPFNDALALAGATWLGDPPGE